MDAWTALRQPSPFVLSGTSIPYSGKFRMQRHKIATRNSVVDHISTEHSPSPPSCSSCFFLSNANTILWFEKWINIGENLPTSEIIPSLALKWAPCVIERKMRVDSFFRELSCLEWEWVCCIQVICLIEILY